MQSRSVFSHLALAIALLSSLPLAEASSKAAIQPQLNQLSCTTSSYTAAGSDSCTVSLNRPVHTGTNISLSSNSSAVTVPSSVTISNGSSTSFTAKVGSFTASSTVTLTATMGSTKTFAIQLNAPAQTTPTLIVSPASLAFGNVTTGQKATQTVTLSSTGTGSVVVNSATVTGTGFSVSGLVLPVTIPAGQSVALTVTFAPTAASTTSGQLTIASTSSNGNIAVSLLGTGTATPNPVLSSNSTSVNFGAVTVNQASTQTVQLSNTDNAAVTISSLSVSGSQFSTGGIATPYTLQSGQSAPLSLVFTPTSATSYAGTLTISSNAPAVTVNMSGSGLQHSVTLNWNVGASNGDPAVGYNVYRAPTGTTSYQKLNTSVDSQTTYNDLTVQSGQTYDYEVKAVDSAGVESLPSNTTTAIVP